MNRVHPIFQPILDALIPTRVCKQCGMAVPADPMKHWHDDYRPDTSDDLQREAVEYQRQERPGYKP